MELYNSYKRYNRKSLKRTVEPATPVVSTADIKLYLKIDGSDEDTLLDGLVAAATDMAEIYCRRAFITQTLKLTMEGFGGVSTRDYVGYTSGYYQLPVDNVLPSDSIELMRPPIQSVTSITTYATDNSSSVFSSANYTLDENGGRIYLDQGQTWPNNLRDVAAVEVLYVAGYGSAATDVPDAIQNAIKIQAGNFYENRACADLSEASKVLLDPYRLWDDLMT